MSDVDALGLPPEAFTKQDGGADLDCYAPPRLVTHIDETAVEALTGHYAARLKAGDHVLDLMSSWVSHLPGDLDLKVVGHSMNAEELAANPRLCRWFVQDLNQNSVLPEPDGAFDAVLVCDGVQYLQRPLAVFQEIRRILTSDGVVIASFSNRCFPTRAVAIWRALDMNGQAALIRLYLEKAGFHDVQAHVLADGQNGDPLIAVEARR
ncbi:Methyltransferase domain-containing protein [Sphingomonas sp. EC-HK361]|uniref:class I SAM-dependent methyltransferase n=1 Tax=Sphingomonas sp. EC-HK361 TaxID=2038397 RepID=UPI00125293AE|nr:methyltransferase domain-containing protein [Sphingomonas sp. EC-HK361]VVT09975.1 Methyltransferase domain-containing protein [Sphingomonas sp. EC-HK361]